MTWAAIPIALFVLFLGWALAGSRIKRSLKARRRRKARGW